MKKPSDNKFEDEQRRKELENERRIFKKKENYRRLKKRR